MKYLYYPISIDDYANYRGLERSEFNVVFTVILCELKLPEALVTLLFEFITSPSGR